MNFNAVKKNYDKGLWTVLMVRVAVKKGIITKTEFKKITGKSY